MNAFSLEALLGLYSIPTIGPVRMRHLISVLGSPEKVLLAGIRELSAVEGIDRKTAERIKAGPDTAFVQQQLEEMEAHGVGVLTYWDDAFPDRLKRIYDPPAFLFYKGQTETLNDKMFAVVGTRLPSSYGKMITEQLTAELVSNGFTIISGFARGVDTQAHKAALKNSGATVAVLGNGLDTIYPSENKKLFEQIIEHGLFLTEYPMGTKPDAGNFPKRNRIISGMSSGVLITEAGQKSGALLTAGYALEQNREVFAVPGGVFSGKSAGSNTLIKNGAKLVQNIDDILEELEGQFPSVASHKKESPALSKLDGIYKKVFENLDSDPLHVDQIALRAELSPSEVLSALLTLELGGYIRQMAGKMFIRA